MKKTISMDTGPQYPSITPPSSPMRRRSMDLEKDAKPKPPVRRRKKFQVPGEDGKRVSSIEEHDEGGSGPTTVESHDQVTNGTDGDVPAPQTSSGDDAGGLERSGEGSGEAEEGWEVISTHVPNIKVLMDEQQQQQQNQRSFLKKSKSEETPVINQIIGPASPDILRTLTKKKKPPPFRPPPYNASLKTPPLPTKKRKAAATKLAEEAKKAIPIQTDEVSREASPDPEEHQQLQQPAQQQHPPAATNQEEIVDGHIYEAVDPVQQQQDPTPLPPVRFLENGHTKYLGSSSSDASLSPSLTRSTSVGNSDNVFISGGGDLKPGGGGGRVTVSLASLRSARNSASGSGKKSRPHSEAVSSASSARDFETSFEVS